MTTPDALTKDLNPAQTQAVQTHDGPVMLIAGPGSGKTRVLTHRVAALIDKGVPARNILALTFTNQAAKEMRTRLETLIGHPAEQMWLTTFHSLCAQILRQHPHVVNLPRNYTILDAAESRTVIKDLLQARQLFPASLTNAREKNQYTRAVAAIISHLKNHNRQPDTLASNSNEALTAAEVYYPYQKELINRGSVDFDDLLLKTVEILTTRPDIRAAYQNRFQYIHVDEFQDTNQPQWEIVHLLSKEHRNVLVVGDPDQAIYGFRGARPNVFETFEETFRPVADIRLGQNYRSTPNIVAVAQAAIAGNPTQFRADLYTDNPSGTAVTLWQMADGRKEASHIAKSIKTSHRPKSDHAILVRTNMQTRALEQEFHKQGITYDLVGMTRFFERAEIKDATAYLRLLVNPKDLAAFDLAVAIPRRGFGPALLTKVYEHYNHSPHPDGIVETLRALVDTAGRGKRPIADFIATYDNLTHTATTDGLLATLEAIYDTGLKDHYVKHGEKHDEDHRVENLNELLNAAAEFQEDNPTGPTITNMEVIAEFLNRAALTSAADTDTEIDNVQIATMHSAKGKEWPIVYVVGVEEGTLPHARSLETVEELQEERRLFFVAVSRAQEELYLTVAKERFTHGIVHDCAPSPFLSEIENHVNHEAPNAFASKRKPLPLGPRTPSSTNNPKGGAQWQIGDKVFHHTFGNGTITAVTPKALDVTFATRTVALHPIVARLVKL